MKKVINNLRNKTEEERKHISHISIFFISIVMITLWIFSLGKSLESPETKVKIKQDLQPFSVLKDNLSAGINNISN